MSVKQRETQSHGVVIDLAATPYFSSTPAAQRERTIDLFGSSRERLRGFDADNDVIVIPDYRQDRPPAAYDSSLRFGGGLGSAASFDVGRHPWRARLNAVNLLTVTAITVVVGVAVVMLTMVAVFQR